MRAFVRMVLGVALVAVAGFVLGAPDTAPKKEENPQVIIQTSIGTIKAELYADRAPISVKNFLSYVDKKFYDNTIFHRVIKNFMIQGGGYDPQGARKEAGSPIKNEASNGLKNERGTLSMARTREADSATCQFFINVENNRMLDKDLEGTGYAVFGKVIEGMDVVDKIRNVKTIGGPLTPGEQAQPMETITITSIRRAK